jgi:hypothetical protein
LVHRSSLVDELLNLLILECSGGLVKIRDHVLKARHYVLNFLPLLQHSLQHLGILSLQCFLAQLKRL